MDSHIIPHCSEIFVGLCGVLRPNTFEGRIFSVHFSQFSGIKRSVVLFLFNARLVNHVAKLLIRCLSTFPLESESPS